MTNTIALFDSNLSGPVIIHSEDTAVVDRGWIAGEVGRWWTPDGAISDGAILIGDEWEAHYYIGQELFDVTDLYPDFILSDRGIEHA